MQKEKKHYKIESRTPEIMSHHVKILLYLYRIPLMSNCSVCKVWLRGFFTVIAARYNNNINKCRR